MYSSTHNNQLWNQDVFKLAKFFSHRLAAFLAPLPRAVGCSFGQASGAYIFRPLQQHYQVKKQIHRFILE